MRTRTSTILAALATGLVAHTVCAVDLYSNGGANPFNTTATTFSGVAAMPNTLWSELQNDGAGNSNGSTGSSAHAPTFRLADDFTVPAGGWTIREIAVFGYQTSNVAQTINGVNLQIWNGPPNAGGTVIFGDTDTNSLNTVRSTNIIRTFSTTVPAAASPTVLRNIWEFRASIETKGGGGLFLPAGTYWLDWQLVQNPNLAAAAIFVPAVTYPGARNAPTDNALQSNAGTWSPALDGGSPAAAPDVPLDFPFVLRDALTPPSCSQDINGDGFVDVNDLLSLIGAWGGCP